MALIMFGVVLIIMRIYIKRSKIATINYTSDRLACISVPICFRSWFIKILLKFRIRQSSRVWNHRLNVINDFLSSLLGFLFLFFNLSLRFLISLIILLLYSNFIVLFFGSSIWPFIWLIFELNYISWRHQCCLWCFCRSKAYIFSWINFFLVLISLFIMFSSILIVAWLMNFIFILWTAPSKTVSNKTRIISFIIEFLSWMNLYQSNTRVLYAFLQIRHRNKIYCLNRNL